MRREEGRRRTPRSESSPEPRGGSGQAGGTVEGDRPCPAPGVPRAPTTRPIQAAWAGRAGVLFVMYTHIVSFIFSVDF